MNKHFDPMQFGIRWLGGSVALLLTLTFLGAEAEWIRAAGFFLAGVGVAPLGLWLAHQRTMSLSGQTENEAARRVTDAFTKAVELLGHESIAVRQGGIYALGRLASEAEGEHPKIMDIVAAYIRDMSVQHIEREIAKHLPPEKAASDEAEESMQMVEMHHRRENIIRWLASNLPMPIDLDAAIAVIRERRVEFDREPTSERGHIFDLSNAFLFNADFSRTSLARVNLSDCRFYGCLFVGTTLAGSNIAKSDFKGSDMEDAKFDNADIRGVDLSEARNLTQAQVDSADDDRGTQFPKGITPPEKWRKLAGK